MKTVIYTLDKDNNNDFMSICAFFICIGKTILLLSFVMIRLLTK